MNLTNENAEVAVLVEMFRAQDPYAVMEHLSIDDFSVEDYGNIFRAMTGIVESGMAIRGNTEVAAMMAPIMTGFDPTVSGMTAVRTIKQLTQRRKLFNALQESHTLITDLNSKPSDILDRVLHAFENARDNRVTGCKLISIGESAKKVHAQMETANKNEGESTRKIKTGIPAIDEMVSFRTTNLVTIAARTGSGKTSLALNMARAMVSEGHRVCYLCREMDDEDLTMRILAAETGEDSRNISDGKLTVTTQEFADGFQTIVGIGDRFMIGQPKTIRDVIRYANTARTKYQCTVFFFDYIQQFKNDKARNRRDEVAMTSDALKAFALDNKVLSIGLAQLNRDAAMDEGKVVRPRIKHIKEAGNIEEDSDVVMLLWNPLNEDAGLDREIKLDCQLANRTVDIGKRNDGGDTRCAVYIDKYRAGQRARMVLAFNGPTTTFYRESQSWD